MRISDWSSDVCSSDLHVMLRCSKTARPAAVRRTGVDTGTECGAILQQIAAVRGAVNGLMVEVLEGHLRGHLAPLQSGDDGDHDDDIGRAVGRENGCQYIEIVAVAGYLKKTNNT